MEKSLNIETTTGALSEGAFQSQKVCKKKGRPAKKNKKKSYTITMDPTLYNTLQRMADDRLTSFSQLVTDVMIEYLEK